MGPYATSPVKKAIRTEILPFRVRKMLVGLEANPMDSKILKYLGFFLNKIPTNAACFLHLVPKAEVYGFYNGLELPTNDQQAHKEQLQEALTAQVLKKIPATTKTKLKIEVKEANPLEGLMEKAETLKTDMVIIGKNSSGKHHHGILAKNFARQVWSNALIVPDNARLSLKNILVPVDFSPNSAEALHVALAINESLPKPAKITLLHVYELPANFSAFRFNYEKVLKLIKQDREDALHIFIQENVPDDLQHQITTALIENNTMNTGHQINAFAQNHKHDLIIMGAKGHSKVALLLMGSVTEKVLSLNKRVPVLIVK